jgi:hypothetical protein
VYTEGLAITDQEYGEISCSKYEIVILERIEERTKNGVRVFTTDELNDKA